MDLELSEDQRLLQQAARDLLERECTTERVRALQDPATRGHSEALWKQLAANGWLGVALAPELGGGGLGLVELGLFCQEAGRVLLPTSFASTVHASLWIEALGTEGQRQRWLSAIAAGEAVGAVALEERQALHDWRCLATRAERDHEGWRLRGTKCFVRNAEAADVLVVIARTGPGGARDGLGAFLVPRDAAGVGIRRLATFAKDPQAEVELADVRVADDAVLGGPLAAAAAGPALVAVTERMTALECMDMVGGAEKVIEQTVAYVCERKQFGVPIGSFQAAQHQLADRATAVAGARLASLQALSRLAAGRPAQRELAIAKAWTGEAYVQATVTAHHLHGGMGYVRESDLHLWSQRAKAAEIRFGGWDLQLERVADALGL